MRTAKLAAIGFFILVVIAWAIGALGGPVEKKREPIQNIARQEPMNPKYEQVPPEPEEQKPPVTVIVEQPKEEEKSNWEIIGQIVGGVAAGVAGAGGILFLILKGRKDGS